MTQVEPCRGGRPVGICPARLTLARPGARSAISHCYGLNREGVPARPFWHLKMRLVRENHPQTEIVVTVAWVVPVTIGRARVLTVVVKRAATQHANASTGPYSFKQLAPLTAKTKNCGPASRGRLAPINKEVFKFPETRDAEKEAS